MTQGQVLLGRKLLGSSAILFASIMGCSGAALAQARPPAQVADDPSQSAADNVIIVTATRRASPLSNVPIAVSAVTAAALRNSGVSDIRQLNQLMPSLLVSSTGSEANGAARVRGVGTVGDNPGLESSVAVFIDGVYRSRTGASLTDLGEVERIEVLRGPQGTLFGRNTSAGLINIVTRSPSFTFGADGEISTGNHDFWRAAAGVTGPITDSVAVRLDGVWSKRDGFLNITDTNGAKSTTNDRNRYLLRGQVLIEPSDALSIRLIGDYSNHDESCCGAVYAHSSETLASGFAAPTNRIATIINALAPGSVPAMPNPYSRSTLISAGRDYVSRLRDWGVSGEINYDLGGAKLTSITAYRDYKSRDYGDYDYSGADLVYRDPNTFREFRTFTQELRAQGSAFADALDWLVGGYYSHEDLTLVDNIRFGKDYGRFAACRLMAGAGANSNLSPGQLSLCAFPIDGNPLTPDIGNLIDGTQATLNAGLNAAFLAQMAPPATAAAQAAAISGGLGNGLRALSAIPNGAGDTDARYMQESSSLALFTHNIWHVTRQFDVTVGLRYTHETKRFAASLANNNATCSGLQATSLPALASNPALGSAAALAGGILTLGCLGNGSPALGALHLNDRFSDDELSGTAVLSYKPTRDLMIYASFARGYKAGGYNLDRFELGNTGLTTASSSPATYFIARTDANTSAATLRFEPENVDSFELGLKYSGRHFGANVAVFRELFRDFQLNTFNGTSFVVQNIDGCATALTAGSIDTGGQRCAPGDVVAGLSSTGVELELNAYPTRDLRVSGGFTYTEARYRGNLVGSSNGQTPRDAALFLLPGMTNSNAPQIVTTASISWAPELGTSGLSALVYADTRITSDYNSGSDLFPEKAQDGYVVVNGRIGLRGPEQRWAIELWAQNLFNENYAQVAINSPLQSSSPATSTVAQLPAAPMANQLISAYLAEPRTFGVTLRGKF